MSRLAFDDLMKSSSLDPIASRAGAKSRTDSTKAEESSAFDDKFKKAVEELQPKEREPVAGESDDGSAVSKESQASNDRRESDASKDSEAAVLESASETTEDSSEPEDPDDVLIAMVMAAAGEQEQSLDAETLMVDDVAQGPAASGENLTGEAITTIPTQPTDADEPGTLQQDADHTEPTAPILTSSEIVVPEETGTNAEAAQATVSTTTDAGESEATLGAMEGLGATQQVEASGKGANRKNNMDTVQDAGLGEGEIENEAAESEATTLETASTSTFQTSSQRGDELAVETNDEQKSKTETSVKVDTPIERPAAASETRSGQQTVTTATPSGTEPTLDTADRVRFVERVAQAFQAQSSENSPVRMRLHPEELGSIKIEMTVRNGTMHARVETETQEARHLLLDNLPALRERLANQHNIKVEQFDINYNAGGDQQGPSHSPEDWNDSGHNGSPTPNKGPGNNTEEIESNASSAPRAASLTGSGKQLDVTA